MTRFRTQGANGTKKQRVFQFNVHEGEEWSSDESDSDYEPSHDERKGKVVKRARKKRPREIQKAVVKCSTSKKPKVSYDTNDRCPWIKLPPELLQKIFHCITDIEGAVPFLVRISRVCVFWAKAAEHPSLWTNVDLTYGWIKAEDRTLLSLCPRRLTRVKELNLSSWKNLTDAGLEAVANNCPLLEAINLSHCPKLRGVALQNLVTKCPRICKLNISNINGEAVRQQTMKCILQKCGQHLQNLEMGGNRYTGFTGMLNIIQNHTDVGVNCRRLEVFDVSNSVFSTDFMVLNLEKLHCALPRLTILRIANTKFRANAVTSRIQGESPGFPMLRELSIAVDPNSANAGIGINDNFIFRVLKSSNGLRLLDLRGTSHVTLRGLRALPITSLEHLYLTQSSVTRHPGLETIMHKWRHSLIDLDLSWNVFSEETLGLVLNTLAGRPQESCLVNLNLSGTSITGEQVQKVVLGCPKLMTLRLSSCRGLPRGMKHDYQGEVLEKLRREIDVTTQDGPTWYRQRIGGRLNRVPVTHWSKLRHIFAQA